ncbi:response regulator [Rhodocytophaga aerolata]|uniref:Response regulator n=1 Tax=Rhodocytophaga aerolata TaxID=455078 RepID=A0ABT8R3F1_9BACT|nr:response regulator [Rhodocytophaga aerolata]MDO1446631.1 response regulator [Rhodocytophaga aerolata]
MKKFNKILLVEDDPIDAFLSKSVIEQAEITEEIVLCHDGQEALDCLQTLKDKAIPDLILLDIRMPGMDGFEFLEELRRTYDNNSQFTVVILTSSNHPNDITLSGKFQASYYLVKPITPDKVKKMIERCF